MSLKTKKQSSGRYIFGTLENGSKQIISGDETQVKNVIDMLIKSSSSYLWSVVSIEKHKTNQFHYHFLIGYRNSVKLNTLVSLRNTCELWSGCTTNFIDFNKGAYITSLGYICKDGKYWIDGDTVNKNDIDELVIRQGIKNKLYNKNSAVGVYTSKERTQENDIIYQVKTFMIKNKYLVNFYTRKIMGCADDDEQSFWIHIQDLDLVSKYGTKSIKLIRTLIKDPIFYELPLYKPDLNYVRFNDCMWDIQNGKALSIEETCDIIPVKTYAVNINYDPPKNFLKLIKHNKWNLDTFKKSYGETFSYKKGRRKFKTLLIHGKTTSGKSTAVLPFTNVFSDVLGDVVVDGSFTTASIAQFPMVIAEEFNIFSLSPQVCNEWKKLLEGADSRTSAKHSNAIPVCFKRLMITSNDDPPSIDAVSDYAAALLARIDAYKSIIFDKVDIDMMDKILEETPRILIWATIK